MHRPTLRRSIGNHTRCWLLLAPAVGCSANAPKSGSRLAVPSDAGLVAEFRLDATSAEDGGHASALDQAVQADAGPISYVNLAAELESAPNLTTLVKRQLVVLDASTRLLNSLCAPDAIVTLEKWDRALKHRVAPILCRPAREGFAACAVILNGSLNPMRIGLIVEPKGPVIRGVILDEQGTADPTLLITKVDVIYKMLAEPPADGCVKP